LNRYKIESDHADNGKNGLAKFNQSLACCPYRLVFMDLNMPIMGGLEATREIFKSIQEYKDSPQFLLA
jgi:CheY-like chemotaxis protein